MTNQHAQTHVVTETQTSIWATIGARFL